MITRRQLGSAALGAAALAGTRGSALAQAPRKGGDVVIAIAQAPPSLDAHITSAQAARNVNLHMYETLYARDESANAVPELAEGVDISGDGLTYTFPIRKGVKFHNGKELDAKDVAASIERYRKVGASPALVAAIDKIDASGPHEVTLRLKQPQSTFLDNISSPRAPIAIYPASEAAKEAGKIEFIGTGPYRFVEYRPDSHVKIARYDGYSVNPKGKQERDGFAGKKEAFIDTVTFRFMPEAGARVAALEAGEIHHNETIDGPTAKRLANDKRFAIYKALPFALQVIKFNHAQPPGNDVNFRRAVQAALDMEEIMAIAYRGHLPDGSELALSGTRLPHQGGRREVQPGQPQARQGTAREILLQGREADLHRRQHPPQYRHRDGGAAAAEGDRRQCRGVGRRLADRVEGRLHAAGLEFLGPRLRHRALRGPGFGDGAVGRRPVARRREGSEDRRDRGGLRARARRRQAQGACSTSSRSTCTTTRW